MICAVLSILSLIILCTIIAILVYTIRRNDLYFVEAVGFSMHPTIKNGEVILGEALAEDDVLVDGVIYAFNMDIEQEDGSISNMTLIKRLGHQDGGRCFFVGDNYSDSIDSRDFGYVEAENVFVKIIDLNGGENLWITMLLRCVLGVAVAFKLYQRL